MAYQPNNWNPLDIITSEKLNDIEQGLTKVSEDTIFGAGGALQPSEGIHSLIYINKGDSMPSKPSTGDTVFVRDGDDYTVVEWDGAQWVTRLDPKLSERIDKVLEDAKTQSEQLISDNNNEIDNTIDEVTKEKIALALADADFNKQAQSMADKALADAKDNTATVAQETLNSANQNIATAKNDITNAYKNADGVISKKVDDTATSIGNTISQNKIDSDGKISTAQSIATQALNEVTTKVSQTDYNAKTGELDTRVTKAQTTADGAVTTVGNYKTSNDARVKATETSIAQNSKDITLRATTADLNSAKSDYNAQIAQVKVDAGKVETTVSNLNDKVNSLGQINQLFNTEWSPDFAGWYDRGLRGKGISASLGTPVNGSNVFMKVDGAPSRLQSEPIPVTPGMKVSYSVNKLTSITIWSYLNASDKDGNIINVPNTSSNEITGGSQQNIGFNKWENITIPDGVFYISLGFLITSGIPNGSLFSQPMLVFSQTVGDYVQGNYNNNYKIASQQVTIDGITDTVSKQGTNIDSVTQRVTTAEGTLSTATDNISGLQTKQTTTANQVTQEISDRKTGDNNTLQSSKGFTTSSITSYDKDVQTQLTQTASGILAQVEATNMVVNSEFDPLNGTWYQLVGSGAVNSTVGTAWSPTTTLSFSDWAVVDGSTLLTYAVGTWFTTALAPAGAGRAYSASIVAGRPTAPSTSTALDLRIGFWDANKKLISNASSGNIIDGTAYKGIDKYKAENKVAPANTKYVSVIIAHSSASATDIIGRPMLNNGTTVSPYVATFGNSSSSTILSLFKDSYSLGINSDGSLVSGLIGNQQSVTLKGNAITLDGNTKVNGDFYALGGNFKNINASNIVGTNASFFQANFIATYGSNISIDGSRMEATFLGRTTDFNASGVSFKQHVVYNNLTEADETVGGLTTEYYNQNTTTTNRTINAMKLVLYDQTFISPTSGKAIGSPDGVIWGGDKISLALAKDFNGNTQDVFSWSNATSASADGTSFGFNFYDRINFNQNEIVSGGSFNFLMSSTKFGSGYFGGKAVPSISATWSGNTGGGIAFGNDNVIIFAPGKTKIIL